MASNVVPSSISRNRIGIHPVRSGIKLASLALLALVAADSALFDHHPVLMTSSPKAEASHESQLVGQRRIPNFSSGGGPFGGVRRATERLKGTALPPDRQLRRP